MREDRQVKRASLPAPPVSWSARLASNMAWYSGVNGACCPRVLGLLGSHWTPPIRSHWPDESGYLASSNALAPPIVITSTAASTAGAERSALEFVMVAYPWSIDA